MKTQYKVIGLMSGTSLDGLDIAFCEFTKQNEQWSFELIKSASIDYDIQMQSALKNAFELPAVDLLIFNNEYGRWLGKEVANFMNQYKIEADLIASHGHTIFHQPEKRMTYQIGSGQEIANLTDTLTACDFRSLDVSLKGQGAPLVPIGDKLLFNEFDFCLNLGGISNISFDHNGNRVAYDIGLANMVLNYLMNKIGKTYDKDGEMAKNGKMNNSIFDSLNNLEYYQLPFPKSTGYEWFAEKVIPIFESSDASLEDQLHTAVLHIAFQISNSLKPFIKSDQKLLITGGGAKNLFLIEKIRYYLKDQVQVIIPPDEIINFKEAIIFAFMGALRLNNEINCLCSVTGAEKDSCSGILYFPQ